MTGQYPQPARGGLGGGPHDPVWWWPGGLAAAWQTGTSGAPAGQLVTSGQRLWAQLCKEAVGRAGAHPGEQGGPQQTRRTCPGGCRADHPSSHLLCSSPSRGQWRPQEGPQWLPATLEGGSLSPRDGALHWAFVPLVSPHRQLIWCLPHPAPPCASGSHQLPHGKPRERSWQSPSRVTERF